MDKPEVTTRQLSEDELDQFLSGTEFWAIQNEGHSASRDERSEYIAHQRLQASGRPKGPASRLERQSGANVFVVLALVAAFSVLVSVLLTKGI